MAISKSEISTLQFTKTLTFTANQDILSNTDVELQNFITKNGRQQLYIIILGKDIVSKISINGQNWENEFINKKVFEATGDIESLVPSATFSAQVQIVKLN